MTLTSGQLATVRDWISDKTPPTDDDLHEIFDRVGSPKAVVVSVLRKRLAKLQAEPSQFAVAGDYSQSTASNITSLERQLAELNGYNEALVLVDPSSSTSGTQQLVRRGARR